MSATSPPRPKSLKSTCWSERKGGTGPRGCVLVLVNFFSGLPGSFTVLCRQTQCPNPSDRPRRLPPRCSAQPERYIVLSRVAVSFHLVHHLLLLLPPKKCHVPDMMVSYDRFVKRPVSSTALPCSSMSMECVRTHGHLLKLCSIVSCPR